MPFYAAIYVPELLLNYASILIFLSTASFVILNEKTGLSNLRIDFFSIALIVVTNHYVFVLCYLLILPSRISAMCTPLLSS